MPWLLPTPATPLRSFVVRIPELDTAGLLSQAFYPYHYCRQCLKLSYLHLDEKRAAAAAAPEATRLRRAAERQQHQAEVERVREEASINHLIRDQQAASEAKHAYSMADEKSKKFRTRERRAGRAFVSVEHTKKEASTRRATTRAATRTSRTAAAGTRTERTRRE